jgi:hypothetical protein
LVSANRSLPPAGEGRFLISAIVGGINAKRKGAIVYSEDSREWLERMNAMNTKLVESLAQIILSLSEEERQLLETRLNSENAASMSSQTAQTIADLENRLRMFEAQYQMSSEEFYPRFRSGELGDAMDFFEWSVFYEMWNAAKPLNLSVT